MSFAIWRHGRPFYFDDVVSSDMQDYNFITRALAAGWSGKNRLFATSTINAVIGSSSTGTYAFDTGIITDANVLVDLLLTINGSRSVIGRGGDGAASPGSGAGNVTTNGNAGGPALRAQFPMRINNLGTIAGGGGGGGGGRRNFPQASVSWVPGGGGAGVPAGGVSGSPGTNAIRSAASGTSTSGGLGAIGDGISVPGGETVRATAGSGGNLGATGGTGTYSGQVDGGSSVSGNLGTGGPAGAAVAGNSNITWINTGTRLGAIT